MSKNLTLHKHMFGKKGPKTETGADHVDVGKVLQEIAGVRAQLYATGAVDSEPEVLNQIERDVIAVKISPSEALARVRGVLAGRQDYH